MRKRKLIVGAFLCLGGIAGILFFGGQQNKLESSRNPSSTTAREVGAEHPDRLRKTRQKVQLPADVSAPKVWIGPQFLRFFAHDPSGAKELGKAYERWRQSDPTLAGKVAGLAAERVEAAMRTVWTRAELNLAVSWVNKLSEGEAKFALMAELGKRLFAFDREKAVMFASQFKNTLYFESYLTEMAEEWAVTDPHSSSAWVAEFPPGDLRNNLELKVAVRSAEDAPAAAAAYVALLDPGPHRDAAAQTITRQWAARDPRSALQWAATYPGEELRSELLSSAVAYWKRSDTQGLLKWIQENPTDPTRMIAAELSKGF